MNLRSYENKTKNKSDYANSQLNNASTFACRLRVQFVHFWICELGNSIVNKELLIGSIPLHRLFILDRTISFPWFSFNCSENQNVLIVLRWWNVCRFRISILAIATTLNIEMLFTSHCSDEAIRYHCSSTINSFRCSSDCISCCVASFFTIRFDYFSFLFVFNLEFVVR